MSKGVKEVYRVQRVIKRSKKLQVGFSRYYELLSEFAMIQKRLMQV